MGFEFGKHLQVTKGDACGMHRDTFCGSAQDTKDVTAFSLLRMTPVLGNTGLETQEPPAMCLQV